MPDMYITVDEAIVRPGLRIAFTRGVFGVWSEAARAVFELKGIEYDAVIHEVGQPNERLVAWTGQASAPVAMMNDERPRTSWAEMIILAERLQHEPRLIPAGQDERVRMFGLCQEIAGDDGLGWNTRLFCLKPLAERTGLSVHNQKQKYLDVDEVDTDRAISRAVTIVTMFDEILKQQQSVGRPFVVGEALTAADIYLASFTNFIRCIPETYCVQPEAYHMLASLFRELTGLDLPASLRRHRDYIIETFFPKPVWFLPTA